MPLSLPTPPSNAIELLAQAITRLSSIGGAAAQVTGVDNPALLNSALPHQVYTLGSGDIVGGRNLSHAKLIALRFLVQYGSKTIAAVELACGASGENLRFASLDTGPFAQATRNVVAQAEQLESVQSGSYEFRVLKAPSVYVMAAWLKNLGAGDDIVMPIDPSQGGKGGPATGGGAEPMQTPNQFLQGMRSSAKMALLFNSAPQAGGGNGAQVEISAPPPGVTAIQRTSIGYTFNRQGFIKDYANMIARTWTDDSYLQLLLANPVDTVNQAGLKTIAGAVIRVIQHHITGTGRIEDEVDAWVAGNKSGLYDLFVPIKPDWVDLFDGGEAAGGAKKSASGNSCCCSPCCCCT